jgi:FtsP/CotA-like multicopper oxidase with cupredoxin domain
LVFQRNLSKSLSYFSFNANSNGTHFYHSHSAMQRADGMFGALIVRNTPSMEPHFKAYDYDLPEHVILVHDWLEEMIVSRFVHRHHAGGDNKPRSMLINGKVLNRKG